MAYKKLLFRSEARESLLKGTRALADAVRITLGPRSKSVLIQKNFGAPIICDDGVTIAKEFRLKEREEDIGAHGHGKCKTRSNIGPQKRLRDAVVAE